MASAATSIPMNEPRLKEGMLLAFAISLKGTADLFPDTPQVRRALEKLTSKKYLGITTFTEVHTSSLYWKSPDPDGPPPLELSAIMPVSPQPPTPAMYPREHPYLDVSQLCVPIHSVSDSEAEKHRPPLELAPHPSTFPFGGAFACTAYPKHLIIEYIHKSEAGDAWMVADSDQERWVDCVQDDMFLVSKAFEQERKDERRRMAEKTQSDDEDDEDEDEDRAGEAEVEAMLREPEPEPFRMPPFEIIYDVWLDFDRGEVSLDPEEHDRELTTVRQ